MLQKHYYLDLEIPLCIESDHDVSERDEVAVYSDHDKLQYRKSNFPELEYLTINSQLKEQNKGHLVHNFAEHFSNLNYVTMNCQLMDRNKEELGNHEVDNREEMEYKVDYQSYNYCHEDICPIRQYHQRPPKTCNAPVNCSKPFHQGPEQPYKNCSAKPAYPPACMCEAKNCSSQTPQKCKKDNKCCRSSCCTSGCCAKPKKEKQHKPIRPVRNSDEFPLCTPSHEIWKEQYRRQQYMVSSYDNQCLPEAAAKNCACKCLPEPAPKNCTCKCANNVPQRPQCCCKVQQATSVQCNPKPTKEMCCGPPSTNSEDYFGIMAKIKHVHNVEAAYNYETPKRSPSRSDKSQDTAEEFFKLACGAPTPPTKEGEPGHKILLLRTQSKPVQIINCRCRLPDEVQDKIKKLGHETTGEHCTCLFI